MNYMRDLRSRVKVSSVIPFGNKDMIDAILIKFSSYIEQSDTILYVRDSSIQKTVVCHIDTLINLVKNHFYST
jgi:hypothetical protein